MSLYLAQTAELCDPMHGLHGRGRASSVSNFAGTEGNALSTCLPAFDYEEF